MAQNTPRLLMPHSPGGNIHRHSRDGGEADPCENIGENERQHNRPVAIYTSVDQSMGDYGVRNNKAFEPFSIGWCDFLDYQPKVMALAPAHLCLIHQYGFFVIR